MWHACIGLQIERIPAANLSMQEKSEGTRSEHACICARASIAVTCDGQHAFVSIRRLYTPAHASIWIYVFEFCAHCILYYTLAPVLGSL